MLASKTNEKASRLSAGLRAGLARCTGATALVALLNIIFLSVAAPNLKTFHREKLSGEDTAVGGALFEGDCETAKQLSVWIHLAINVLSSVLLTSSNYTQQVLTAPTRGEVNRAHAKHSWLNIGILSYRNLREISKRRVLAWVILAITAVPIHLLYNSVVSLETSANAYTYTTVRANETSAVPDTFVRLENDECISQYARQFVTTRSDVFIVIPSDYNNSSPYSSGVRPYEQDNPAGPLQWMCWGMPKPCDAASLKAQSENWTIFTYPAEPASIKYCLSKPVEESCRLAMSVPLMAIVVGCNVLKLVGLGLTWIFLDKQPLLTLGDAAASFLECPDPMTTDSHLLSIGPGQRSVKLGLISNRWQAQRRRWAYFISPSIYAITMVSSVAVIIVTSFLLREGIQQISKTTNPTLADLWERGFGSVDVNCLVDFPSNLPISTSLVSNAPQLIVSIIYTTVNGMWTAMMMCNEWNGYGLQRKSLRTTYPVGQQRSSHWLSLPWKYGLPLVAASVLLHWLISQSIFFVRLIILEADNSYSTLTRPGYSPIAIIFSIICGAMIMVTTVGLSLIPCKTAIPQIGTCSAVLSAACHPPEGDKDAALKEVKWGVVSEQEGAERCCVSSWRVMPPIEGDFY